MEVKETTYVFIHILDIVYFYVIALILFCLTYMTSAMFLSILYRNELLYYIICHNIPVIYSIIFFQIYMLIK